MDIKTLKRNLRILPTRLKIPAKYIFEANFSGFDTVNSVVHLGYGKNRDKSSQDILYCKSVIEALGDYKNYLKNVACKINELREKEEPIIHFIEIDYWKYREPVISIAENEYVVFTSNHFPSPYFPSSVSLFEFLEYLGVKKTRIMGELASSQRVQVPERECYLEFVSSEDGEDSGCLRGICDLFLAADMRVEPIVECSFPYKWDSHKGRNPYYEKSILSGWHDMSNLSRRSLIIRH